MKRRYRYTKEQIDYVREIAEGRYNEEIAELFNKRFGTNVTSGQMNSLKGNHGIRSNVSRARPGSQPRLFTDEQETFIRENVIGKHNQTLVDLVNEKFNLSITVQQMRTWKKNHGLKSGLRGSEGMAPPNKGTKGIYNVGGNVTSFKPGQRPSNYKPVGHERVDQDGYILVKVSDEGDWHERWRAKHRVVWEEANGPIPEGHVILFADRDKTNLDLDNLLLISNSQLARMNQNDLIKDNPELTKTGLIITDIITKVSERKENESG